MRLRPVTVSKVELLSLGVKRASSHPGTTLHRDRRYRPIGAATRPGTGKAESGPSDTVPGLSATRRSEPSGETFNTSA